MIVLSIDSESSLCFIFNCYKVEFGQLFVPLDAKPPWSCLFTAENRQLLHTQLHYASNYRSYRKSANFSYVCNIKSFGELFTPYLKWNSCQSSICVFCANRFRRNIERLIAAHPSKTTRWHAKKPKKVTLFRKLSIDTAIQLQITK